MSAVAVYSYTHSVTYVADNILKSLKDIIRLSGLDPQKLIGEWGFLLHGISSWIESKQLECVTLEIYDPKTDKLVKRWDIGISYTWAADAGTFWTDTEQLKYAIKKAGLAPSEASYRVMVQNKDKNYELDGWTTSSYRSTEGMVRQTVGTTVEHNGLGANASYWRKSSC